MIRVMFICHGNICRSPMAEFVFRALVARHGCSHWIEAASSATSREELGNPVHTGTHQKLRQVGIACPKRQAVQLTKQDYATYDYLICMDQNNLKNALQIVENDPFGKLSLLLQHAGRLDGIADPWYTGNFDDTYQEVLVGCTALLNELTASRQDDAQ